MSTILAPSGMLLKSAKFNLAESKRTDSEFERAADIPFIHRIAHAGRSVVVYCAGLLVGNQEGQETR